MEQINGRSREREHVLTFEQELEWRGTDGERRTDCWMRDWRCTSMPHMHLAGWLTSHVYRTHPGLRYSCDVRRQHATQATPRARLDSPMRNHFVRDVSEQVTTRQATRYPYTHTQVDSCGTNTQVTVRREIESAVCNCTKSMKRVRSLYLCDTTQLTHSYNNLHVVWTRYWSIQ